MTDDPGRPRLRLAARTLVEWRTPHASDSYRAIVQELVAIHPLARRARLDVASPIWQLDSEGNLIWYLSEFAETTPVSHSDWNPPVRSAWYVEVNSQQIVDSLLRMSVADANERVWRDGPHVTRVADATIASLLDGRASVGADAAIALMLPLPADERQKAFSAVLAKSTGSRFLVVGKAAVAYTQGAFTLISATGLVLGLVSGMFSQGDRTGTASQSAGAMLVEHRETILLLAIVGGAVATVVSVTRGDWIRETIRRLFLRTSAASDIRTRLGGSDASEWIAARLEERCSTEPAFMQAMLGKSLPTARLALAATPTASAEVTSVVLRALRDPALQAIRDELFDWLCRVKVEPEGMKPV